MKVIKDPEFAPLFLKSIDMCIDDALKNHDDYQKEAKFDSKTCDIKYSNVVDCVSLEVFKVSRKNHKETHIKLIQK
jgi:hypothetical protein